MKDFLKRFRKGSLSTKQIITMIILIASFIVVLFFFTQLNLSEESKSQLCRNSVMQKSSTVSAESGSSTLQCTTKYVCLTADGSCDEMVEPDEKANIESRDDLMNKLSEQKAQCWWMFGSGEVNYVGKDVTKGNYCSICHQTYLDDSLSSIDGVEETISKDELYQYMTEHNYSDSQTYAQFVLGTNDIEVFKKQVKKGGNYTASEVTFGEIETGETYFNTIGIISQAYSWWEGALAAGGIGYTGSQALDAIGVFQYFAAKTSKVGPGLVSGAFIIASGVAGGVTTAIGSQMDPEIGAVVVEGRGIKNQFMAPTFQKAESDKFKALNCEKILTDSS